MWILIHGKKRSSTAWLQTYRCWVWQSHLDPNTMVWKQFWSCWVWKLHSSHPTHAPHQLTKCKNDDLPSMLIRLLGWFLTIFHDKTEISLPVTLPQKREGYEMSFDTMVWLAITLQIRTEFLGATRSKKTPSPLDLIGQWLRIRYDMRSLSVNQINSKKKISTTALEAQQAALDFIKPGVTAHEVDRAVMRVRTGCRRE